MDGRSALIHQRETAKFFVMNRNAYCFNDMGTGKTLAALWAADFLMRNNVLKKVLVVAPLSTMISAWARDLVLNIPGRRYAIAHGTREKRIAAIQSSANFVIINHDGIKIVQDALIREKFGLMIIDELTAFKNYSADRTKAAERVARAVGAVWGLTGKPTPNGPIEAFGQAKVVNPYNPFLPKYFTAFRNMVETKINQFTSIPKPEANDIVHRILQPAIRYTRAQCIDLPPCTRIEVHAEMTREQKDAYEAMRQQLLVEYRDGLITAQNAAIKALKLLQISSGAVKDDSGRVVVLDAAPRFAELMRLFEETPNGKLVVFAAFRADVERIRDFFRSKGITSDIIYGSVDQRDRARHIQSFQDGALETLIIQPQSAAHGITLTAASTVVWWSLIPSNEYYDQANHRIIRMGQTREQLVAHMIGSPADRKMLRALENKDCQANDLLESFEDFLAPMTEAEVEP